MRLPYDVERARELVLEHGWNATSYQIVNPGITHWFSVAGDAVVGHVQYAGYRVVAGAPVCARERLAEVIDEFETDSRNRNRRICYFGAEARLDEVFARNESHSRALLGAQPAWDPAKWSAIIRSHSSLRAQLNRARNKGVTIVEYSPDEAMQSQELNDVLTKWLASRGLPPLHFLVEPDTLDRLADRRIFVARQDESVVAFAVLSPIPARNGWLVEQFPRVKGAPNGTIELLLTEAVTTICESGASYVTLGLAPLARRNDAHDEPWWLRMTLNFAAAHGRRFYNFRGLESFKAKFHPETWEPIYAIADSPRFPVRALLAIGEAFLMKPRS
jgi:phosphatidylglycerol lysyltransferase